MHLPMHAHTYAHVCVCPLDKHVTGTTNQWSNMQSSSWFVEEAGLKQIFPRNQSGGFCLYWKKDPKLLVLRKKK